MGCLRFRPFLFDAVALPRWAWLPLFLCIEMKDKEIFSSGAAMLATLSDEMQVNRILEQIDCVPSNFSEIADRHSNSRVIAALKGTNDFDPEDSQYYLNLARQMKKLAEEYPVPIDWRKTQRIKEILAARKTHSRPIPFAVVFVGPALFKQISSGQIETTTSYQDCAAFKNAFVARAAAQILDEMGQVGVRYTTITNEPRGPETLVSRLADLGFESVAGGVRQ